MTTCIVFIVFCFAAIGAAFYSAEAPVRRIESKKLLVSKPRTSHIVPKTENYDTTWFKEYTDSCAKF